MANLKGARTCLETLDIKPNYSELGRIYGMDRRTAKKKYNGIENKAHKKKISSLDKYADIIKEKLKIPGCNMKAVYQYLKLNVDPNIKSYSNFRKYVNNHSELLKEKNKDAHVRFETEYGKQLQFDWKGPITLHFKNGNEIVFYIFSTTLSASRFHTFIYDQFMTREEVQRCLIKTFQMIGGVPEECVTDNMSSIVNYANFKFTPEFNAFCKDMGFKAYHCKVGHCFTKGKDESCNRFMNWLLPYDFELSNEDELIQLINNLNKEINKEINQTTNMPPVTLFQEEKEHLQPMPRQDIINSYIDDLIPVKVDCTMLFYYNGCRYSVPKKCINQTVKIKESDNKLFIYYNKELVAVHNISQKKINYRYEDYVEGLCSSMPNKSNDEIEQIANYNLNLLSKFNK